MIAPIPKAISEEIIDQMKDFILSATRFLDKDDERVIAWGDQLKKSMFAKPGHALACLGFLEQICGDADRADEYYERALQRGADRDLVVTYSNLGYVSKALKQFVWLGSEQRLNLPVGIPTAVTLGGFKLARRLLGEAEKMNVSLDNYGDFGTIRRLTSEMADSPVEDAKFAELLDLAGDVLRDHRLFWTGLYPIADFDEFTGWASIRYEVDVTPDYASQMNREFDDLVIAKGLHTVPLTVGFIGTRVDDWLATLRTGTAQ